MKYGYPVLFQDVDEYIDPVIDNVLEKNVKGLYVFQKALGCNSTNEVLFSPLSVCLSVCLLTRLHTQNYLSNFLYEILRNG